MNNILDFDSIVKETNETTQAFILLEKGAECWTDEEVTFYLSLPFETLTKAIRIFNAYKKERQEELETAYYSERNLI